MANGVLNTNEEQNRVFLISPLNNAVINIVQGKLDEGFYLNYEEFRQLAWGERGQEIEGEQNSIRGCICELPE